MIICTGCYLFSYLRVSLIADYMLVHTFIRYIHLYVQYIVSYLCTLSLYTGCAHKTTSNL